MFGQKYEILWIIFNDKLTTGMEGIRKVKAVINESLYVSIWTIMLISVPG